MRQRNKNVIIFTKDAESALLDIEKKYKLEESPEDVIKKIREGKSLKINTVADLSRKFFENDIQEKSFIDSLQKNLSVDKNVAENIFNDVDSNIMPFLIKTSEEEIQKGVFKKTSGNDYTPDKTQKKSEEVNLLAPKKIKTETGEQKTVKKFPQKRKPETPLIEIRENKNISTGTDNYREPIE